MVCPKGQRDHQDSHVDINRSRFARFSPNPKQIAAQQRFISIADETQQNKNRNTDSDVQLQRENNTSVKRDLLEDGNNEGRVHNQSRCAYVSALNSTLTGGGAERFEKQGIFPYRNLPLRQLCPTQLGVSQSDGEVRLEAGPEEAGKCGNGNGIYLL